MCELTEDGNVGQLGAPKKKRMRIWTYRVGTGDVAIRG